MLVVHCTLRAPQSIPLLNDSSLRKVEVSNLPRSDHTRSVEAKQLDEGIVDTFVSVGLKNGAHTSVSISASDSSRIPRAAHLEMLLDERANLVSFRLRLVEPQLAGSNQSKDFKWTGERPHVTYSRHLLASAEDLVHCSGGHHAETPSRLTLPISVSAVFPFAVSATASSSDRLAIDSSSSVATIRSAARLAASWSCFFKTPAITTAPRSFAVNTAERPTFPTAPVTSTV
jgi:hypothetical protein